MSRKLPDKNRPSFEGFSSPNYTIVPDELFDVLMPQLTGAELKVLLYIIRRTFGFKKDSDSISLNQICNGIQTHDGRVLDQGTGLSQSTVLGAIKGLDEKNVILAERRTSQERGNEPTLYRLNVRDPFIENRGRGGTKIGEGLPRKSGTQHTVEQETVLQNTVNSNSFEPQTQVFNGVPSFQNSKNKFEFLKNDALEDETPAQDAEEPRRGDYQPLTPSTNSLTAIGEVLKSRKLGTGRKSAPRSSKTASTADSRARAGVRGGRGKPSLPEAPEWLQERIRHLSDELHDPEHTEQNISQANHLFLFTGGEEDRFADKLSEAKKLTLVHDIQKRADGEAGELFGMRNKMPYFFKVLRDVLGLKDVPASKTRPANPNGRGRGKRVHEDIISP